MLFLTKTSRSYSKHLDTLNLGSRVKHGQHGIGTVQICQGNLAIVEFDSGIHRVLVADLEALAAADQVAGRKSWDAPLSTLLRLLGESIQSVNDSWGVFSPSNIDLLPHQLWVCKKVNTQWPTRWLVADDVGLGKTIEAGLILWPLVARGQAKRVLVLTPAGLVEQWRDRLYNMFDLRLQIYRPEEDKAKSNFWERESQVVASFHTLRLDRNDRHKKLFEASAWDLVIVDEAHHLNSDEKFGPTKAYRLLHQLESQGLIESMVFFTGTPHRGKDYGFLSLLQLLRPDLFNPREATAPQLASLPSVIVRNNKYTVTDLQGNRLFKTPKVRRIDYSYSPSEQYFYDLISEFIASGFAYSNRLSNVTMGNAVGLVLIAIQKLAASSVAAVLRALLRRLEGLGERRSQRDQLEVRLTQIKDAEFNEDLDRVAQLEEELASRSMELLLMEDEQPHLCELIAAAQAVTEETKIEMILNLLSGEFQGRQVLIFTEYKATQSLLISRLNQRFGDGSTVFINGDERAEAVLSQSGRTTSLTMTREQAADDFNAGRARYLVATEAGGEGIDLQERCWTLIHADMPWNPMRMHQRVGRLNRYGQQKQVEVLVLNNQATVESRIFDKLTEKIGHINRAFDEVMEEPEDLFSLVLGLTPGNFFSDLYAAGRRKFSKVKDEDSFSRWFDQQAASFGGKDAVDTVKGLVGNCAKFDFQSVSASVPKVDLPQLRPYFEGVLTLNHRRPSEDGTGLSFVTPDEWRKERGIMPRYQGLHFDRTAKSREGILGVGHKLMVLALQQTRTATGTLTGVNRNPLGGPLFVFRVRDGVTVGNSSIRLQVLGVLFRDGKKQLLKDWEVVLALNSVLDQVTVKEDEAVPLADGQVVEQLQQDAIRHVESHLGNLDLPFRVPHAELLGTLWH